MKGLIKILALLLGPVILNAQSRLSLSEGLGLAWQNPQVQIARSTPNLQPGMRLSLENIQATTFHRLGLMAFFPSRIGVWIPALTYQGFEAYQSYGLNLMAIRTFGSRWTVGMRWQGELSLTHQHTFRRWLLGMDLVMSYRIHPRWELAMLMQAPIPLRRLQTSESWPFGRIELGLSCQANERMDLKMTLQQDIRDIPEVFLGFVLRINDWFSLGCSLSSRAAFQLALNFHWQLNRDRSSLVGLAMTERLSSRLAYTQTF